MPVLELWLLLALLLHPVAIGEARGFLLMAFPLQTHSKLFETARKVRELWFVSIPCVSYVLSLEERFSSTTGDDMGFIYGIYPATPG